MIHPVAARLILTLFLITGAAVTANAGLGIWTSAGPNGGRVISVLAGPSTPNVFYAATRGGVFKSIDGGLTWSDANAGIDRQLNGLLAHSRTAPNTLYAFGVRKVYHSSDGAASWSERSPSPGLLPADTGIVAVATSPTTPGRLFIALSNGDLLRSDNSGLTWNGLSGVLPLGAAEAIRSLASHPVNPGELLVAVEDTSPSGAHRVFRVTGAGSMGTATATAIPCPAGCPWESQSLRDIEFHGMGGRVWATGQGGAARSDDFGATWTLTAGGFGQAISVHPADATRAIVAGGTGVVFTVDDGLTWSAASSFVGNGIGLPAQSTDVVHDPFSPGFQLVGTQANGVYRNISSGSDVWVPQVTGMNARNIRAVAKGPANRLHAGVGDSFGATFASFLSNSFPISWGPAYTGLEADQLRAVEVDPNDTSVVYGGGSFFPQSDGMGGFVNGNGGIYKSTDGGSTWTTVDNGIPLTGPFDQSLFGTVRAVEIDETSQVGGTGPSQKLLAGGSGRFIVDDCSAATPVFTQQSERIFVSTDAGASWSPSESGLGGAECSDQGRAIYASVVQIVQSTVDPLDYWAATFIGGLSDSDAPSVVQNGVFRSTDGGATWSHASMGLPRVNGISGTTAANILSLAFDPTDPAGQTLYASSNDDFLGTVYKTTDGGSTWTFAGSGLTNRDVRDLRVDPTSGDVYAAAADPTSSGDGGVFVSQDGGASWSSISTGFPASAVATKLELDTTGLNLLLHAGTTRGVQSFEVLPDTDTDGASNQTEDAAPTAVRGGVDCGGTPGGDGNGDGICDSVQPGVASPRVLVGGLRGEEASLTATITPLSGTCDALENSFGLELLANVPTEAVHEAPFNGLHLRLPDCEEAQVDLIYHGRSFADDPSWGVRGYGLVFPDAESSTWLDIEGAGVAGNTWTFVVADGASGDA
ncbi:MAG: hypothetical protein R3323_02435, partial [Wenzhouxiangellaceae bacterium]|nr:hypothetical protein [Wenzhouxiangellaceae bacterium]